MRMLNISSMNDLIANSMDILEPAPVDAEGNERQDGNSCLLPVESQFHCFHFQIICYTLTSTWVCICVGLRILHAHIHVFVC